MLAEQVIDRKDSALFRLTGDVTGDIGEYYEYIKKGRQLTKYLKGL